MRTLTSKLYDHARDTILESYRVYIKLFIKLRYKTILDQSGMELTCDSVCTTLGPIFGGKHNKLAFCCPFIKVEIFHISK